MRQSNEELRNQRDVISGVERKGRIIALELEESDRVVRKMIRKDLQHKLVLAGTVFFLALVILAIVYRKLYWIFH